MSKEIFLSKEDFLLYKDEFISKVKILNKSWDISNYKQFKFNVGKVEIDDLFKKAQENQKIQKQEEIIKFTHKRKKYLVIAFAWTILFQFLLIWFLWFWVYSKAFWINEVYRLFFIIVWENFVQILILAYIILRLFDVWKTK